MPKITLPSYLRSRRSSAVIGITAMQFKMAILYWDELQYERDELKTPKCTC